MVKVYDSCRRSLQVGVIGVQIKFIGRPIYSVQTSILPDIDVLDLVQSPSGIVITQVRLKVKLWAAFLLVHHYIKDFDLIIFGIVFNVHLLRYHFRLVCRRQLLKEIRLRLNRCIDIHGGELLRRWNKG
jgi:hypothetical protein